MAGNIFQSTLPVGGATISALSVGRSVPDFNPRSPCGATTPPFSHSSYAVFQSTLPVWGATRTSGLFPGGMRYFNPRSPCGERRNYPDDGQDSLLFQSTLPVWGATSQTSSGSQPERNFNPRSPCGERPTGYWSCTAARIFQSTLPVWGATLPLGLLSLLLGFQSTLPVWGATYRPGIESGLGVISIHAPRVGSDPGHFHGGGRPLDFNPRSPCGERRHNGSQNGQ